MNEIVPIEKIARKIYLVRDMKVMLDRDLAALYEVETRVLKQAVRRNIKRFPEDFMFHLTQKEFEDLRSQFVMLEEKGQHFRYLPFVFTEQGVAMLSSVLKSDRAIQVNIQIMRAFTQFRQMLSNYDELKLKIEELESKYDDQFSIVFKALKQLIDTEGKPKRKIGF